VLWLLHISRTLKRAGLIAKLNATPVSLTTYTDSSVQAGQTYFYVATARGTQHDVESSTQTKHPPRFPSSPEDIGVRVLWAATPRQLIHGDGRRLASGRWLRSPCLWGLPLQLCRNKCDPAWTAVSVVRFSDGRRIQFPEWAFEFFCPVKCCNQPQQKCWLSNSSLRSELSVWRLQSEESWAAELLGQEWRRQNRRRQDSGRSISVLQTRFSKL